ncbi:MAG TPA: ligase-associated DNA damage response endonuclease PdeM [Micavibrio sp.]|nr:ligase-associated DNA damage response endonuclease PdeM [Micavibrio sp.]
MIISFGGHDFFLHHSGALFWPSESMLIVSDLHLEKGSHFARRGFFLPPYDSHYTISRLADVCQELQCKKLLLLGDAFHDEKGFGRLGKRERAMFKSLLAFHPIWIRGNHDRDFVPEGFYAADIYAHKGITFRHETAPDALLDISGHFHPKVDITNGQKRLSSHCFIEDGQKMIVPAFGAFTGGLDITDPAIRRLLRPNYRIYPLGKTRVYRMNTEVFKLKAEK